MTAADGRDAVRRATWSAEPDRVAGLGGLGEPLLVARAREGDQEAFGELVCRQSGRALALARRILDSPADAEDAVQEAFVDAWRRLPEFRGDAAFSTWMYRIVTRRCLNVARRRRPAAGLDEVPEPAAGPEAGPERVAEGRAAVEALRGALAGLTPDQRACWVLRELYDHSYEEIADLLGIGPAAVRGRIFRARKHLTEAMSAWR